MSTTNSSKLCMACSKWSVPRCLRTNKKRRKLGMRRRQVQQQIRKISQFITDLINMESRRAHIKVPEDMKSCHCGHVFTQPKSINGKRFTEGRFYCEAEEDVIETKKKQKSSASVFYKERVTYMPGYSYEDDYEVHEKKERKRRRKKPMNLINESMKYHSAAKTQRVNLTAKDIDLMVDGEPLIQVLQEINNKITNQTRLWINLDS